MNSSPDRIKVQDPATIEGGQAEMKIKRHLGRGLYLHDVIELESGNLEIALGNVTPRDLSDCRQRDNVLKFVTIRDVYTIRGEPTGRGYYVIDLPDRSEIVAGIEDREQEILDKLDFSMAQAIYGHVYDLPNVRNQLNPILEILRWVRRERLSVERIRSAQRSANTDDYLTLLDNLDYVDIDGRTVVAGERLQAADLQEMDREEFGRTFFGDVVKRGYYTIRDKLDLSMLGHYQKYAGAYYYDAVQRGDRNLWLDTEAIAENMVEQYDERRDPLYIGSKLGELDRVGVLEQDGDFVRATQGVYEQVVRQTPTI